MSWLVDTLIVTGALIALVLVTRRPVARAFGPGMAYALWALPMVRLILPPLLLPAVAGPFDRAETIVVSASREGGTSADAVLSVPWTAIGTVWLIGAGLYLAWRLAGYVAMRRRLLTGARQVGAAGRVRLVETAATAAPVAFGVFDQVIALPLGFIAGPDRAARDLALAHELEHHAARDLAVNLAVQPLLALHWFNPLAWAAWNAMRRDQEAACDARAMAGRDARTRAAYARVIASFAAGERLGHGTALAASMACPVLGDKSIVHRLKSLTMAEISPRRARIGRWTLATAAALALPLTATVVHAGQDAPIAPVPPTVPAAPKAPAAPHIEKHVVIMTQQAGGQGPAGKMFEKRVVKDGKTIVIQSDMPIDEVQLDARMAELDRMGDAGMVEPPQTPEAPEAPTPPAAPGERREVRKFFMHGGGEHGPHEATAMAMVMSDCGGGRALADADVSRDSGEGGRKTVNRTRVLLCGRAGEAKAEALASVRKARAGIAANKAMPDDVRREVLDELDHTIADMEKDAG